MKLLQVYSAKRHPSGNIDMEIRAEVDGEEMDVPFGYRPGDPHGLGPQLDAWWAENQKFPIANADPLPEPDPTPDEPAPAAKLAAFLRANPDVMALIEKR